MVDCNPAQSPLHIVSRAAGSAHNVPGSAAPGLQAGCVCRRAHGSSLACVMPSRAPWALCQHDAIAAALPPLLAAAGGAADTTAADDGTLLPALLGTAAATVTHAALPHCLLAHGTYCLPPAAAAAAATAARQAPYASFSALLAPKAASAAALAGTALASEWRTSGASLLELC